MCMVSVETTWWNVGNNIVISIFTTRVSARKPIDNYIATSYVACLY